MLAARTSRITLQWGHAFVSVETDLARKIRAHILALQWGHAFVSVETCLVVELAAGEVGFNGATLL